MIEAQVANSLFREIESSHRAKLSEARKPAATGRQDTNHIKIIVLFGAGFSRPGILAGPKTHYAIPVPTLSWRWRAKAVLEPQRWLKVNNG